MLLGISAGLGPAGAQGQAPTLFQISTVILPTKDRWQCRRKKSRFCFKEGRRSTGSRHLDRWRGTIAAKAIPFGARWGSGSRAKSCRGRRDPFKLQPWEMRFMGPCASTAITQGSRTSPESSTPAAIFSSVPLLPAESKAFGAFFCLVMSIPGVRTILRLTQRNSEPGGRTSGLVLHGSIGKENEIAKIHASKQIAFFFYFSFFFSAEPLCPRPVF